MRVSPSASRPCGPREGCYSGRTLIVVQLIVTSWTKASRGAPDATKRNASPTALVVPGMSLGSDTLLLHKVAFNEPTFEPRSSCEAVGMDRLRDLVHSLALRTEGQTLRAQYVWSLASGAPERPHGRAIRVRPGESCQILS